MKVELEAIKFNHDTTLVSTGAINLRRNETQIVTVPEWTRNSCSLPECSAAAYTTLSTPKRLTIQGSFIASGSPNGELLIMAKADPPHILGDVAPHPIPLGSSGYILLDLPGAKIANAQIGIYDIRWRWQFSDTPDVPNSWTDFQTTKHRIYTVLSKPKAPWEPSIANPTNIHQPWTDVLDYACKWAAGVQTDHDLAATHITKCFNELGTTLLKYKGGASYAGKKFQCTKFLDLLGGGIGNGKAVNCDDCATVVSTFANILGCDLSQSGMGLYFNTNRIKLIGEPQFRCTTFFYHSVAWKGACKATDAVFDGCLQVDNDGIPANSPEDPLQPTNLLFGIPSDKTYQFCLVDSDSEGVPIPNDQQLGRQRRQIGKTYLGDVEIKNEELLNVLRRVFSFTAWPKIEEGNSHLQLDKNILAGLVERTISASGRQAHSFEHTSDERFTDVIRTIATHSNPEELLNINLYQCSNSTEPNSALLNLLGMFHEFELHELAEPRVGEVAFSDDGLTTIVFRRSRFLALVRSVGWTNVSVLQFAMILDEALQALIQPHADSPLAILNTDNLKGKKMAHRLASLKRSFKVVPSDESPLKAEGFLDLSRMNDSGVLSEGRHFVASTGQFFDITGSAVDVGNQTFLTFRHTNNTGRFEGVVTYAKGNEIVVSGTFFTPRFDSDMNILEQVEDPWVITKP